MSAKRPEPTDEELRSAFARCRKDTWPATFEDAMADAMYSRLLRLNAMHPPRAHRAPPQRVRLFDPIRPPRDQRSRPLPGIAPGHFDRKRAAAGDRDDD